MKLLKFSAWLSVWATALLTSSLVWVTPVQAASALDQLRAFSTQTKTARGEFTQNVISRTQKRSPVTSGDFIFERPGKFRWTYRKPHEQIIVADGTNLTIYDRDLNQATLRKLDDALGATPAAILFGSADIEQRFRLIDSGTHEGIDWLEAIPKTREANFERINIGFRDGQLVAMELRDTLGQTTRLNFTGVQRNISLPGNTFTLSLPKDADVLRQ